MVFSLPAPEFNIILYISLVIILATILGYIARALKQPTIIAYFLTGLIIGPFGLGLLASDSNLISLSELGIAFLLFIAGLDLNLGKLKSIGLPVAAVSIIQMVFTFMIAGFITFFLGYSAIEAFYFGIVIAFSSTLVVVKYLSDRKRTASLFGRWAIGILLLQDIFAVLILSFLPNIGSLSGGVLFRIALSGAVLIFLTILMNRIIIPNVLRYSAKTKELFFLTSLSTAFLFISLSYLLGFSIAIGGFLAGIALASYPYNIGIGTDTRPLRDFFLVIFFTTLGMQVNPSVILPNLGIFFILFLLVLIIKPLTIIGSMKMFGYKKSVPVLVGLYLAQASEFSFIIVQQGLSLGQISGDIAAVITIFTLFTMVISPYIFSLAGSIAGKISRSREEMGFMELKDHIVILGCHKAGKYVIENVGHPLVCVDHDPDIIENIKQNKHNCVYGEADNEDVLEAVNVSKAKLVISAIPDLETNIFVVKTIKRMNHKVHIIARALTLPEALQLYKAGADYVVVPMRLTGEEMLKNARLLVEGKNLRATRDREIDKIQKEVDKGFMV
jgi:Kef-type K+ transport system membrane component KefB